MKTVPSTVHLQVKNFLSNEKLNISNTHAMYTTCQIFRLRFVLPVYMDSLYTLRIKQPICTWRINYTRRQSDAKRYISHKRDSMIIAYMMHSRDRQILYCESTREMRIPNGFYMNFSKAFSKCRSVGFREW